MYKLAFLFSMFLALNVNALTTDTQFNSECTTGNIEECLLSKSLFSDNLNENTVLDIASIEIIEIEEEVALNFDAKKYLPVGFNALKGKDDLDWSTIEVLEIEEEVALNFDTTNYLPVGFNALKGRDDLDWSKIEIIEIEEEVALNFDTTNYLPVDKDDLGKTIVNMVIIIEKELGYNLTKKIYCSL